MNRTRVTALVGLLLLTTIAARAESYRRRTPLVCPSGSKLEVLDGPGNKVEYCAVGNVLHGPAREWYPNGKQRTSDHWSHGKQVGLWIVWDEKGARREERCYRNGKLEGRETFWYANGQRESITHYSAGAKDGPIAEWTEDGVQTAAGQFVAGQADGKWTFRDPDTGNTWFVTYVHGKAGEKSHIPNVEFSTWVESPAQCDGAI